MIYRATDNSLQQAPRLVTRLPGPRAAAWIARDDQVLSPSYTRDYPLVAARAQGCALEDVDGNVFLDFTAGLAVTSTGHCHPEVVEAIQDQAARLIHMSGTDFYYTPEIELAERLAKLAPGEAPKRVFFTNSGTESIEAALKLARFHTGRGRVLSFYGAFHGRTYGAMSLGGSKAVHQQGFDPLVPGIYRLAFNCSREELDELFARVCPADTLAAIVVEVIQGEGGYRIAEPRFLAMLRETCDRHGILLVFDEVQTGIGRTGKMFACEHFGIAPDLLCLAKGIASGLPLGALVARADLMSWGPGSHASTFGGNPICCRAALATLDLVEREYLANATQRGAQLRSGLDRLAADSPLSLGEVRGLGLMQAVDVLDESAPTGGQPLDPARRNRIIRAAFERGLLLVPCGRAAVRFCPALCVSEAEVDAALALFAEACQASGEVG
ncbi:MAG: aminotransferase class III-fold pyridoxal phosphate-dependent enzyme [Pirellulales bacterium]|nr:aminotransferase class III-fold pyridoxal phosphate-dependent enzyme [Pirellulales bacterium]